jgi:hypothetical protein
MCPAEAYIDLTPHASVTLQVDTNMRIGVGQDFYGISNTEYGVLPQWPDRIWTNSNIYVINLSETVQRVWYCYQDTSPTPTPSPTPSLPDRCERLAVTSTSQHWLLAGQTYARESGYIEHSAYGVGWSPLTTTITLTDDNGIWFRGNGTVIICDPPTPTPTPPKPEPEPENECELRTDTDGAGHWEWLLEDEPFSISGGSTYHREFVLPSSFRGYDIRILDYQHVGAYGEQGVPFQGSAWEHMRSVMHRYWWAPGERLSGGSYVFPAPGWNQDVILHLFSNSDSERIGYSAYSGRLCFQVFLYDDPLTPTRTPGPTRTATIAGTATGPTRTPIRPEPMVSRTPTRTAYPTPVSSCAQLRIPNGTTTQTSIAQGAYLRTLNGIAVITGADANYQLDADGMIWEEANGNYQIAAISLTDAGPSLVVEVCPLGPGSIPTRTATLTATAGNAPTWTPRPAESICVDPATPPPAQTGQIPNLSLIIPTLGQLPSMTPVGTLTSTLVITPAETMIASLIIPAETMTGWSAETFGENGYADAQTDAEPIVSGMSRAFGWLAVLQSIGPLAWLLPPLIITVLMRVSKPILSLIKYIKQIIPVIG